MTTLKVLICVQLLLGVLGVLWGWGMLFEGAMGVEYYSREIKELKAVQGETGDLQRGGETELSRMDLLSRLGDSASDELEAGGRIFFAALGLIGLSGVELWLVTRLRAGKGSELPQE